jgi:hypothetical protein
MASETVRIHPRTWDKLKDLADALGEPMTDVLEAAVETYRRQKLLVDTNAAFAALKQDPKAWAGEQAERAEWDATSADGLGDD